MSYYNIYIFFFFQAEDGIRDDLVTGVQTCALPISGRTETALPISCGRRGRPDWPRPIGSRRSEERRVGKECRYRWCPSSLYYMIMFNRTYSHVITYIHIH